MSADPVPVEPNIGLCARCQHLRRVHSQRGATFYLCRRAATDPNYPKYPPLPVLRCPGYEPADPITSSAPAPPSP